MFFPGSRYLNAATYQLTLANGAVLTVVDRPPLLANPVIGYHRRLASQRLDHIANYYLGDPMAFWRLCDANNSMVPDTLASQPLIGIPSAGS